MRVTRKEYVSGVEWYTLDINEHLVQAMMDDLRVSWKGLEDIEVSVDEVVAIVTGDESDDMGSRMDRFDEMKCYHRSINNYYCSFYDLVGDYIAETFWEQGEHDVDLSTYEAEVYVER